MDYLSELKPSDGDGERFVFSQFMNEYVTAHAILLNTENIISFSLSLEMEILQACKML